jgi:hypothetical protein
MILNQCLLSKILATFFLFVSTIVIAESSADSAHFIPSVADVTDKSHLTLEEKYLADISVHSPQELLDILMRADMLFESGQYSAEDASPIIFLLHGDEARILFKQQYENNKEVVDLAAKLTALNVVDIKVCDIWINGNNLFIKDLQPFVGVANNAMAEAERLVSQENYQYF